MDVLLRAIVRAALRRGLAGNLTWLGIALFTIVLRRALWNRDGVITSLRDLSG